MRLSTAAAPMLAAALTSYAAGAPTQGRLQPTAQVQSQETAPAIEDVVVRLSAASRPGAEHHWLEPLVGSWTMDIVGTSPAQPPLHMTGTCESRWILGGRFLLTEVTGGAGVVPIEAMTIYGFDARKRQFFAVALNSLATDYAQSWGGYDPVGRSFILSGKRRDEATGLVSAYRNLLRIEGPDRHVLQVFFDVPGRPPLKVIEAVFARRSPSLDAR